MGNPLKGLIEVPTSDVTYKLRFGMNEIIEFGQKTGRSIDQVMLADEDLSIYEKLELYRQAFWTGLQENHPGITEREVGNIVTYELGFDKAALILIEAISAAFPEAVKNANPRKKKPGSAEEKEKNEIPQTGDPGRLTS